MKGNTPHITMYCSQQPRMSLRCSPDTSLRQHSFIPSHTSTFFHKHTNPTTTTITAAAGGAALTPKKPDPSAFSRLLAFQQAFWKFLRPHTIRGTILGSVAVTSKALLENSLLVDWGLLPKAILGVVALLCGNGYIVGINQIYDEDIDKVNKPFLPVASGELSKKVAWFLCIGLAIAGMAITGLNFGPLITSLYSFGLFLGTIYSIPPLRLKRSAVAAFMIIATVRGFLLNFGVYYAVRSALGLEFAWSRPVTFITAFVTLFATAIAITKDLPDIEGDRKYGIDTFATRLGVRGTAMLGTGLLSLNYLGAIAVGLMAPVGFNPVVMVGTHAVLGLSLILATLKLNRNGYGKDDIAAYYRFIWNLFYSEYLIFPWI